MTTEVIAKAGEEFTLNYNFETNEYSVHNANGEIYLAAEDFGLTSYGYPKAPKGNWRWLTGQWEKILAAKGKEVKISKPKKGSPKSGLEGLCAIGGEDLKELSHYHTRNNNGAIETICCPCAVKEGYRCTEV